MIRFALLALALLLAAPQAHARCWHWANVDDVIWRDGRPAGFRRAPVHCDGAQYHRRYRR